MHEVSNSKRCLGLFQLLMIAIVSVDSLRNLPIGAQYGTSLVTFYVLAGICFFFPLAWISAQLAVRFPNTGGSYLWVEAAFGKAFGYLSIWLQWTYNIIWYPTIFAFITGTLASLIHPDWETNKWFILISCLSLFWIITFVHTFGMRASSWISACSAIVGTMIPMFLIIGFAVYWLLSGNPSATPLTWHALLPDTNAYKNLAYFSNILFSLLGLEVIAMHAGNVKNPGRVYPKAFFLSACLILATLSLSSLSLCVIVSPEKISLMSGVIDVFKLFFETYHIPYGALLIGWCIVIGGFGIASSWMIGIARGLQVAFASANVMPKMQRLNKQGVPTNVLIFQGIVYSILLSAFLLLPNVNSSYWILSALSAQFALFYYVLLFAAAIKLLLPVARTLWVKLGSVLLPGMAGLMSLMGIAVGFLPPSNIQAGSVWEYELFMVLSIVVFCLIPFLVLHKRHKARA